MPLRASTGGDAALLLADKAEARESEGPPRRSSRNRFHPLARPPRRYRIGDDPVVGDTRTIRALNPLADQLLIRPAGWPPCGRSKRVLTEAVMRPPPSRYTRFHDAHP